MSTQPTIKKMQDVIITIRKFAEGDDCNPHLKPVVSACADVLETVISERDWEPTREAENDS